MNEYTSNDSHQNADIASPELRWSPVEVRWIPTMLPVSPKTYIHKRTQYFKDYFEDNRVPWSGACDGCSSCCSASKFIVILSPTEEHLFPEAIPKPEDLTNEDHFNKVLPKKDDGSCVHLVNDRCSIYERRPLACRTFDCRDYALVSAVDQGSVELTDQVLSIDWKFNSSDDYLYYFAAQLIFRKVYEESESMVTAATCAVSENLILDAIENHGLRKYLSELRTRINQRQELKQRKKNKAEVSAPASNLINYIKVQQ